MCHIDEKLNADYQNYRKDIPRSNLQDVLIDEKYESMVQIKPVDSLDEVLQYALVGTEDKLSLVERLANVIDTIDLMSQEHKSTT